MLKSSPPFSPILADLVARSEEEWGDPEKNRANMLYFGINYVDSALYGIKTRGEIIGIQGEEKNRKSTLLANLAYNISLQLVKRETWMCIDTLESGMEPEVYKDILLAMVATRKLIADVFGKDRKEWPKYDDIIAHPNLAHELKISPEFLFHNRRTEKQYMAIEWAKKVVAALPIVIFGAAPKKGEARNLAKAMRRWDALYQGTHPQAKGCFVRVFAQDHIQQISGFDSDYHKLEAGTNAIALHTTTHPGTVSFIVSQVSTTSVRLAAQNVGRKLAKGGGKLSAEINVLFETEYKEHSTPHRIKISVPRTRRRPPPPVLQEIDPESGAFLRPAYPAGKWNE